jgi:hypothetical protein
MSPRLSEVMYLTLESLNTSHLVLLGPRLGQGFGLRLALGSDKVHDEPICPKLTTGMVDQVQATS